MFQPQPVEKTNKLRILVAPLDWGLGHATRCIPVIYELIRQNAEVWLAGEGAQESLLKKEFLNLPFIHLEGYRVKYGSSRLGLLRAVFLQTPRMLATIKKENEWLKQVVNDFQFDAIISDNRYGLYHPVVPCIFMTHQLRIKTPFGKWADDLLQKRNYRFIHRFSECWIPDDEKSNGLAGELAHPAAMPAIPVHYTGLLSRLKKTTTAGEEKNHLFIALSGPEPQRTLLENKLVNEISHYNGTATIVRGLPEATNFIPSTNDLVFYNHLPAEAFAKEMERAEYIISRSGYSTVMDIAMLEKKSILIPTPGQTEQEYLASYLAAKQFAFCMKQNEFSLPTALKEAAAFDYKINACTEGKLPSLINSLLQRIETACHQRH